MKILFLELRILLSMTNWIYFYALYVRKDK